MEFLSIRLFGVSLIKQCVEFSLIFFGTAKQDCALVTAGLRFLLLSISVIIASK